MISLCSSEMLITGKIPFSFTTSSPQWCHHKSYLGMKHFLPYLLIFVFFNQIFNFSYKKIKIKVIKITNLIINSYVSPSIKGIYSSHQVNSFSCTKTNPRFFWEFLSQLFYKKYWFNLFCDNTDESWRLNALFWKQTSYIIKEIVSITKHRRPYFLLQT